MHDLEAGHVTEHDERQHQQSDDEGAGNHRREAFTHTALHERLAEGHTLRLQRLEMPHQADAVAHRERQHRDETEQRTEQEVAAAEQHGDEAAQQRHRHGGDGQQRQAPTAECHLDRQEDQHRSGGEVVVQRADRLAFRKMLSKHACVMFEREVDFLDAACHLARHRGDVGVIDVGADVDAPGYALAADHVHFGRGAHIGHVRQAYLVTRGRVDQQVADVLERAADVGLAHHDDVEHLLFLKQRAHSEALHERRSGAPNIARLQPIRTGPVEIDLDFDRSFLGDVFDARVRDALDLVEQLAHFFGLGPNDLLVVAVDANADAVLAAGQDFAHLLRQEGMDLAPAAGVVLQHLLHRLDGVFVVELRVDADPDLGGVDIGYFLRKDRPADMRRGAAHALDRLQLLHQRSGRAIHRVERCTRRALPLDDDVGLLELGQPGAFGNLPHHHADDHARGGQRQRRQRRTHGRVDDALAAVVEFFQQLRRAGVGQRSLRQQVEAECRRQSQRDRQRREHRNDVRPEQRLEERRRQPLHEQHRQRRDHDDRGGVEHRAAHLDRGAGNDGQRRLAAAVGARLAQPANDVVDAEDGVVDNHGHRQQQAGDDHHVDVAAARGEGPRRGQQRARNHDRSDQRAPPVAEQCPKPEDNEQVGRHHADAEVGGGALDERRGPIDVGVDLDALHAGCEFAQRRLDSRRDRGGVGAGELLDRQHQAGVAILEQRVADQRLVVFDDGRDFVQRDRGAVDRHLAERLGRSRRRDVPHAEALVWRVDEAARARRRRVQEGQR